MGSFKRDDNKLSLEELQRAAARREESMRQLDKLDAEESLLDYVRLTWPVVEYKRQFVDGWAVGAISEHLTAVTDGQIRKLLMNVPPGFMKSLMTSVFWPSWEWGPRNNPSYRYVCASYSEALTIRDNTRCRKIIGSDVYQMNWGDRFTIDPNNDAKVKFANDKTGWKLATSVGGVGTGERGDRVIIDDPHNVFQAESDAKRESVLFWFTEVMPSRVNDPDNAVFIVIMQRVHEYDVSGLIIAKELGYEHLCIPMHYESDHPFAGKRRSFLGWMDPRNKEGELAFPERYTEDSVAEMEKAMMSWGGSYAVAGQMQQRPEPRGGGMVKKDWFEIVPYLPEGLYEFCRGWDLASTEGDGDGSASVKTAQELSTGDLYVVHTWWEQVSPGGLRENIIATLQSDGYTVFQSFPLDPGQAGKYQAEDFLDVLDGYDFEWTPETGEKETRFRPWAAQVELRAKLGRKVKIVRHAGLDMYLDHVSKFPRGRYKDLPDAQSRSYGGLVRRLGSSGTVVTGGSICLEG